MQTPHQALQIALELLFAEEVAQLLIYNKSNEIALELSNPQEAICYPPPEDGKTKNEHSEHQTKINACILEKMRYNVRYKITYKEKSMAMKNIYEQVEKNIDELVNGGVGFSIPVTHEEIEEFKRTYKISSGLCRRPNG